MKEDLMNAFLAGWGRRGDRKEAYAAAEAYAARQAPPVAARASTRSLDDVMPPNPPGVALRSDEPVRAAAQSAIAAFDGYCKGRNANAFETLNEVMDTLSSALAHPAPAAEPESPYELLRNPIP